jgi:DNA-binding beta-propeller fold protein YncE
MTRTPAILAFCLVATFDIGAQPPSGRLLVLNKDDAAMAAVDASSGKVLWTVAVGEGPHELTVSADGKYAFASNYGTGPAPGHTISMIDLAARKELRRIDVSPLARPHGLAFAGGKLYFTAEANKAIARYDPATDKIDWRFETGQSGTHMILVSKDLKRIYTSNIGSDSVSIIESAAGDAWNQTTVAVGKGPEALELSPDGTQVWTAHSRDGGVSAIDVASKKVIDTFDAKTARSNRLKLTPDGRFVLISDDVEAGVLAVFDRATHAEVKRIPLGKMPEGIVFSSDGSRVFVAVNGENAVAVVDPKTWTVRSRIQPGRAPDGMAYVK